MKKKVCPELKKISIFEIFFKNPEQVDQFSSLLKDNLQLPVEWEPFDFFGNRVVYDAAFIWEILPLSSWLYSQETPL